MVINIDYFGDNKVISATLGFFLRLLCCDNGVKRQEIPKTKMYIFSTKKICMEVRKHLQNQYFFWQNAITHTFTFQLWYLITPIWRWQIDLLLHQIWGQSEKFAIGSARHSCHLSVITGLRAISGWTQPHNK